MNIYSLFYSTAKLDKVIKSKLDNFNYWALPEEIKLLESSETIYHQSEKKREDKLEFIKCINEARTQLAWTQGW